MNEDRTISPIAHRKGDDRAARTLSAAFQDDPALAWLLPDPEVRRARLMRFFRTMERQSHRSGEVLASAGREAVSLWYPPGEVAHGFLPGLIDNIEMVRVFRGALPRGLRLADAMHAHHPVPQDDWYLRYVGVAPEAQGKRWGSAILRAGIERAAQRGCGVLLETAKPDNVAIYSRLGFEIISEWQVPGDGPRFWTMRHA